jgi:hypothetical protein
MCDIVKMFANVKCFGSRIKSNIFTFLVSSQELDKNGKTENPFIIVYPYTAPCVLRGET